MAAEWRAQTEVIDPGSMPLTRLVNTIIDGVATSAPAVAEDVAKFLASDLLVYRAEGPEGLVERQAAAWDPVLAWARDALGARFVLAAGMIYVTQTEAALAAARAAIPHDIWRLGAVHTITTLTGSALIALAVLHGRLDAEARLDGGPRRRGLEHGFLGPRRACAQPPGAALCRAAGRLPGAGLALSAAHFFDSVP